MHARHLPRLGARYWLAITLASVFGANLGDFCSHVLALGHVRGLPVLAIIFAAILLAERMARGSTEAFYWAAIVTLRTAATNLADFATHDLRLSYPLFIGALSALLLALVLRPGRRVDGDVPDTGGCYWLAMLVAGTLGTALGDGCADQAGLVGSTVGWAVVWAVMLFGAVQLRWQAAGWYWLAIGVVRTVGTNAGDMLAGRHGFALGLPVSTSVSAAALVAVLLAWPPAGRVVQHAAAPVR